MHMSQHAGLCFSSNGIVAWSFFASCTNPMYDQWTSYETECNGTRLNKHRWVVKALEQLESKRRLQTITNVTGKRHQTNCHRNILFFVAQICSATTVHLCSSKIFVGPYKNVHYHFTRKLTFRNRSMVRVEVLPHNHLYNKISSNCACLEGSYLCCKHLALSAAPKSVADLWTHMLPIARINPCFF